MLLDRPDRDNPRRPHNARMSSTLRCPRCASLMAHLLLAGRHDKVVEIDHCSACRLVWFDPLESVQLAGLGWVALLRTLQQGAGLALPPARAGEPGCPRCSAALKQVHNRSRFGLFAALECPRGHGHLHSHSGLLAERGLVRSLLPAERKALLERSRHLDCLNCGAPADGSRGDCRHCGSALVLIDLPRLAHALCFSPHDEAPRAEGLPLPWHCAACGSPLNPNTQTQCGNCGQLAVASSLLDLNPVLDAAELQLADAATERLLQAARRREQRLQRPPRQQHWRDTQAGRLLRFAREDPEAAERRQAQSLALGLVLLVLVLVWVFG